MTVAAPAPPRSESRTGSRPRFGIVRFPGSNCDQDAYFAIRDVLDCPVEYIWHEDRSLRGIDVVVLPGGFAHGDYLRCGAIARFAPVMEAVQQHAARGGHILGICNGFQVLCEAHLLPGALTRNEGCRFLCQQVRLRVENADTPFTRAYTRGARLSIPIAHGEGRYVCDATTLTELEQSGRILFRYVDDRGEPTPAGNPNGSTANIAGIANAGFNVLGMMPHPERACEKILGSADGLGIFKSVVAALAG